MNDLKELAGATDPALLRALGSLRRMAISLTTKALWQLVGFRLPDGKTETFSAEPFTGIGVSARPSANGKPEAIVVMISGAKSPMIVAIRDEKTRAAIAGALLEDESMLYNSKAVLYVKADGTLEARSANGTAIKLPTMADLAGIIQIMSTCGAGTATAVPATLAAYQASNPLWPEGTAKFKAE